MEWHGSTAGMQQKACVDYFTDDENALPVRKHFPCLVV